MLLVATPVAAEVTVHNGEVIVGEPAAGATLDPSDAPEEHLLVAAPSACAGSTLVVE